MSSIPNAYQPLIGFCPPVRLNCPNCWCSRSSISPRRPVLTLKHHQSFRSDLKASAGKSAAYDTWARVRAAVSLSRVFADHLGEHALHRLSDHKYKVVCPFHNDKNPSLHIDDSLGLFHCFGCSAKGSVIDFEQLTGGHRSVSTALRSLAAKYPPIALILRQTSIKLTRQADGDGGINNEDSDNGDSSLPARGSTADAAPPQISRRIRLTQIAIVRDVLRDAASVYLASLWNPDTPRALQYLQNDRRLGVPTLRAFGCGFAPPQARPAFILSQLTSQGHEPYNLSLAGITRAINRSRNDITSSSSNSSTEQNDTKYYDIFRDRVVFPIRDLGGHVISFAARALPDAPPSAPKYINGADSLVFSKRESLFGADLAATAPSATVDDGFIIVLEGYLDVMSLFDRTQGRAACVATMGTSASVAQLRAAYKLLKDPIDGKVIINFDADDAGIKSVERLCDSVIPQLHDCAHAFYITFPPPPAKDADDFLNALGEADDYVEIILNSARPWYQWRGDRIVQAEAARLERVENSSDGVDQEAFNEGALTDTKQSSFDIVLSEFMRVQQDDMVVAFGATPDSLKKSTVAKQPAPCSDEVKTALAEIVASAHKCLPWLNVAALVQSWADCLTRSTPSVMVQLYDDIINRTERLTRTWRHLSLQTQVYWMPPAPWLLAELPEWKRKRLGYGSSDLLDREQEDGIDIVGSYSSASTNSFSESKLMRQSMEKIQFQNKYIMPILNARQCDRVKRLKSAPRRSAEEIILRALIFAPEADRLDGLSALVEVMIRCQERNLPFWTSAEREQLFEYLASVEGPMSAEEMAAYLEEYEWFTPEIEELFLPIEEETDYEWQEIRRLEYKNPLAVVKITAGSVEKMAGIVASRKALDNSGDILQQLVEKRALLHSNSVSPAENQQLTGELEELTAKQFALHSEIDRSKFLTSEELAERKEKMEAEAEKLKWENERKQLLKDLEGNETLPFPEWMKSNNENEPE